MIWNFRNLFSILLIIFVFNGCKKNDKNSQINENNEIVIESNIEDGVESKIDLSALELENAAKLYSKCISCHGKKGTMVAPGSMNSILIANLSKESIVKSLHGYRDRTLVKGPRAAIMYLQAMNLSDEDIDLLSSYISNFKK